MSANYYNYRQFNEAEYCSQIAARHEKIAQNPTHKILVSEHFGTLYIVPEIAKEDGQYVDTKTGEIAESTDYFAEGYTPNFRKRKNVTFPFLFDNVTEFSPKYLYHFWQSVMQHFFDTAILHIIDTKKAQKCTFKELVRHLASIKGSESVHVDNGVYEPVTFQIHCYNNHNITLIFTSKQSLYEWKDYLQYETFISQYEDFTFMTKINLRDLYTYFHS